MKVLITGAAGQLGSDCLKLLLAKGHECRGVDRDDFDLTDPSAVKAFVLEYRPDAIVHCAAWTNLDRAEDSPQKCADVNAMGTMNIVRAALAVDARLVYISTAHVFNGEGNDPWQTGCKRAPRTIYGLSKAQGEEAVASMMKRYFIVRCGRLFGTGGDSGARRILNQARRSSSVTAAADQYISPAYTLDVAGLISEMLQTEKYGIYHAANRGTCSQAQFAEELLRQALSPCTVQPVPMSEIPEIPKHTGRNLRLDTSGLAEAGFTPLPEWHVAVSRFLREIGEKQ